LERQRPQVKGKAKTVSKINMHRKMQNNNHVTHDVDKQ